MILAYDPDFFGLLVSSYRRTVRLEPAFLEPGPPGQHPSATWLYQEARHPVLAHNADPDPRFIYANKAAQACFEYGWDEIVSLPSRLSAEPVDREERQRLSMTSPAKASPPDIPAGASPSPAAASLSRTAWCGS